MHEYLPLLIVGAIIGALGVVFIVAWEVIKRRGDPVGLDRNMAATSWPSISWVYRPKAAALAAMSP